MNPISEPKVEAAWSVEIERRLLEIDAGEVELIPCEDVRSELFGESQPKELMGHASIVTTMRYIHATDQVKRGAIIVLSEYRQKQRHKFVTEDKRQAVRPAVNHC